MRAIGSFRERWRYVGAIVEIIFGAHVGALVGDGIAFTLTIIHLPRNASFEASISTHELNVPRNGKISHDNDNVDDRLSCQLSVHKRSE